MVLEVEVVEGGFLRVQSPDLPVGTKITLSEQKGIRPPLVGEGSWESLEEVFQEMDKLDIPRRSHEEILRELHRFRGTE